MIIEFGARNYCSFKEGFDVSFMNSNELLKVLCIKGANASGKTNVLKSLSFMKIFATSSFQSNPNESLTIYSYFHKEKPVELYIVFKHDDIEYKYEIIATKNNVIEETLYKKNKRYVKIIERKYNEITKTTSEYKDLKVMTLRSNASLISTAYQYGLNSIQSIYEFFKNIITNVHSLGRGNESFYNEDVISEVYYNEPKLLEKVLNFLKLCDLDIKDIKILFTEENKKKRYFPIFEYNEDGSEFLTYMEQSDGVKSLYKQLALYFHTIIKGTIFISDEFDINLHPDLLPLLVNLFEDTKINRNNAQLFFTTHNNEIMDKLGQHKIILVNRENKQSYLYRLDELPSGIIRNDRLITPIYNTGRIGGKPNLNSTKNSNK